MKKNKSNELLQFKNQYHRSQSESNKTQTYQRRLRKILPGSLIMLGLVSLILVIGYLFSPLGHVQKISVVGVNYLGAQQVIDASRIDKNTLVLQTLIERSKIEKQIKTKVPLVKTINYHYQQFNQLTFTVREYQTVGFITKKQGYYRVLENQQLVNQKLKQPIGNFPVYQNLNAKVTLKQVVKLYLSCSPSLRSDISEIHGSQNAKEHPYRVNLYMNDGNLVVGDIRTLAAKLKYYPAISKTMSKNGVINLEVGAYSKPFGTAGLKVE